VSPEPGRASRPQRVLVIDDAEDIHDLVEVRLRDEQVEVRHAFDAESGLAAARHERPDLVLLDLDLPGRTGLEVCRELMADPSLAATPVIVLTGTATIESKVQAFEAGAIDYVTKPFDAVELKARVRSALRTKRYHDLLATRAQLDGLTGLWNRAFFDARLAEDVATGARYGREVALLLVDIDHFKAVNDRCGHPFGDAVLRQVADAIAGCLRTGDVACRYGGEEFGLILREADPGGATAAAERVRATVAGLVLTHGGVRVRVTVSVGHATTARLALAGPVTPQALLEAADRGLYLAKRAGRDRVGETVL
jgi:two-component system, cell cycle response regulator